MGELQALSSCTLRSLTSVSKARNLTSVFMQLCIDASASVPFCKRVLSTLYALANANRSVPTPSIRARKRTAAGFVL
jgi:hypothetical protein